MKQAKHFLALIAVALFTTNAWAQMTFTYSTTAKESTLSDGSTLVQFANGTDLNVNGGIITGVKVGGTIVQPSAITPNPSTTFITDGEIETFVYDGKAYSFRFMAGQYFTAVMFSDPHVAQSNYEGTSVENMQDFVSEILKLGKEGGKIITFEEAPGYVPTTDIAFCLGDMDTDSEKSGNNFKDAIKGFNDASVPFITIAGNHDLVPDYWDDNDNGSAGDKGLPGGNWPNTTALELIEDQYNKAEECGNFTVEPITDGRSNLTHPGHFTFMYKGVRFYCANNYWFQKPYSGSTYYAADGTINALKDYVEAHVNDASVWISHFPFYSQANDRNDAYERWWLDQSGAGHNSDSKKTPRCVLPTDAKNSEYYNEGTFVSYLTTEGQALAEKKQKALADIIVKTKNPRHFSGHSHRDDGADVTATNGLTFRDHTIQPAFNRWAFVVLCKEGEGAIAVQRVQF